MLMDNMIAEEAAYYGGSATSGSGEGKLIMRLSAIIVLVDLQMWCATRADSALGCVGAEV